MSSATIGSLEEKIDSMAEELHQIRVWIVGNGEPGIFGRLRDVTDKAHTHTVPVDDRSGKAWSWRRWMFDVTRSVATVLILAVGSWAFAVFVLGLRVMAKQ